MPDNHAAVIDLQQTSNTDKHNVKLMPDYRTNLVSQWFFCWLTKFFVTGYKKPLEDEDLFIWDDDRKAHVFADSFDECFQARLESESNPKAYRPVKPKKLYRLYYRISRFFSTSKSTNIATVRQTLNEIWFNQFWFACLLEGTGELFQISSPVMIRFLVNFLTDTYNATSEHPAPPVSHGYALVVGIALSQAIATVFREAAFFRSMRCGTEARSAFLTLVYRRSLSMTDNERGRLGFGRLVSSTFNDCTSIEKAAGHYYWLYTESFQLLVILAILLAFFGPSCLAGFGLIFIAIPFQIYIMKLLSKYRREASVYTDKRSKLCNEVIGSIKLVKLFAWETPFIEKINILRKTELQFIGRFLVVNILNYTCAYTFPVLGAVLTFVTYTGTGHSLNPSIIFSALALFQLLTRPLFLLPLGISSRASGLIAAERLTDVLKTRANSPAREIIPGLQNAVEIQNASFSWETTDPNNAQVEPQREEELNEASSVTSGDSTTPVGSENMATLTHHPHRFSLKIQNLSIPWGKMCAIIGPVGSGKSSLLRAILGEMRLDNGQLNIGGSITYCPQIAWIQNGTLRENIVFGGAFDSKRYWAAVKAANLIIDLNDFDNADLTIIGEKGINLSGGQRQRVQLARAIYHKSDMILLDDPVSAVDAGVGDAIFRDALEVELKGITRIVVTHALHYLPRMDYIICVENGRISDMGTFEELSKSQGGFSRIVASLSSINKKSTEDEEEKDHHNIKSDLEKEDTKEEKEEKDVAGRSKFLQQEERIRGSAPAKVYHSFFLKTGGGTFMNLALLSLLVASTGSYLMVNYWLVFWRKQTFDKPTNFYMGIYACIGVINTTLFMLLGCLAVIRGIKSSSSMFRDSLNRVARAPMSFFDTNPSGRILTRFTKDFDNLDLRLNNYVATLLIGLAQVFAAVILVAIIQQWFLLGLAGVCIISAISATIYKKSAREIRRIEALRRSNLSAQFTESISGISTIRAYNKQDQFRLENEQLVDKENAAYHIAMSGQRWLSLNLDLLASLLTLITGIIVVSKRNNTSPISNALVLSTIVGAQNSLAWVVRHLSEIQNDMASVERITHYANDIPLEKLKGSDEQPIAGEWPNQASITFSNAVIRYRPDLSPSVTDVSLDIKPGEKIGIVGRSGSGKSTLLLSLFRMVELESGSIHIDGRDISTLDLETLRSQISIIPQEPILFQGTLRYNMDPLSKHTDAELYASLKSIWPQTEKFTKEAAMAMKGDNSKFNLDQEIEEDGINLSIGERSLISLARALVRNTNVYCLDEATASVDYDTDAHIQRIIAEELKGKTLICIAHRLRTILAYDRIAVMSAGKLVQFDSPIKLFDLKHGEFYDMCQHSKITRDDIIAASSSISS